MKRCVVLFLSLAMLGISCGKKADPGLPMPVVPEAPSGFRAVARSEGIFILWRAPEKNVNDTFLLDLAGFRILRAHEPIDEFCPRCPKNTAELADIAYKGDRGKAPEKKQYHYQDTALDYGMVYFYQMNAYNEREKAGKATKPLLVYWDVPPAAPVDLKMKRDNKLLKLSWKPVTALEDGSPLEGFAGYTVYRSIAQGIFEEGPLNAEPLKEAFFEDVPDKIDVTYFYQIRAMRMVKETPVESRPSNELQVAYRDIAAPEAPKGLTAIPRPEGIELKWIGSFQKDLAGYNIYRKEAGAFVRLNKSPIRDNSWIDRSAKSGGSYAYSVTAVDTSQQANESTMSETALVLYKLQ